MLRSIVSFFIGGPFGAALKYLFLTYPIWLPIGLIFIFWDIWIRYVIASSAFGVKKVILEIKLPPDLVKSPMAMEVALAALHQTGGESTLLDRLWKGWHRAISSLEIVSDGGNIHFYIWVRKWLQHVIEGQLYSQYPGIEIHEVPDYTLGVVYRPGVNAMYGSEYKLTKPDAYPLKTYIDYGMGKDPKEEVKIDPFSAMLEFFGAMNKGEKLWMQMVIRAHKKEKRTFFGKRKEMVDDARKAIEDIARKAVLKAETVGESEEELASAVRLSPGEREIVAAIERSLTKNAFDVGIRAVYIADREAYRFFNVAGITNLFKPFSSQSMNTLRHAHTTSLDFVWEDFNGMRLDFRRRQMLDAYKRRGYFFRPHKRKWLILSAEELATIYHLPGQIVAPAPTLKRIPSKKAEAPANLPI